MCRLPLDSVELLPLVQLGLVMVVTVVCLIHMEDLGGGKTECDAISKSELCCINKNISGFPDASVVKNLPASAGDMCSTHWSEDPQETEWQPTPVFLPGKSHEQRSLAGYSIL